MERKARVSAPTSRGPFDFVEFLYMNTNPKKGDIRRGRKIGNSTHQGPGRRAGFYL
jgi:hypothetical protein